MPGDYGYVLDTSAWSAFFAGDPAAPRVQRLLGSAPCATSVLSIAELSDVYHRSEELAPRWPERFEFIEIATDILPVRAAVAERAGVTKVRRRKSVPTFGLVDAIILETARFHHATLLTTDADLRGMRGVAWLRR